MANFIYFPRLGTRFACFISRTVREAIMIPMVNEFAPSNLLNHSGWFCILGMAKKRFED